MKELIKDIKCAIHSGYNAERILREIQQLKYCIRYDWLIEKALNSREQGTSSEKLCEEEVIVSLTSYGKRLYDVAVTIESIMQGSMKPNKIILWLGEEMKSSILPLTLRNQQKRGLEISFCKDIHSYTKLIPTLRKYPNDTIITIDDDAIYHYDLIEKLVNRHKDCPQHIIANRIHRVVLDCDNRPVSYLKWEWYANPSDDSSLNFFTGVGGVLYPPHSLDEEVLNESVFVDICKYADDVWFNAMALKKGTKTMKCYTHDSKGEDYMCNMDVQDTGLNLINNGAGCANDRQLKAVFDKYKLWDKLN